MRTGKKCALKNMQELNRLLEMKKPRVKHQYNVDLKVTVQSERVLGFTQASGERM